MKMFVHILTALMHTIQMTFSRGPGGREGFGLVHQCPALNKLKDNALSVLFDILFYYRLFPPRRLF